jgi:LPXTG-motif cell wall-anchored protein
MSNRAVSAAVAAMLCVGACLLAVVPAGASPFGPTNPAAGYPPPTTTTLLYPTFATQFESVEINGHFVVEACGFFPVSAAHFNYSPGGSSGTFTVDSNGCITIIIYAYDPHVTINGGPLQTANFQGNTVVVVGTGANTAQRTYTLTFNIVQPSSSGNGSGTSSGSPGSASGSGSGAPSAGSASGSGSGSNGNDPASTATTGTLAFTGTNALATAAAGLLLLVAGGLLVLFTRRRHDRAR